MASKKQLELSGFIKSVHQTLRQQSQTLGCDLAWKNHCSNEPNLRKYARAMEDLAVNFWGANNRPERDRVTWTRSLCLDYFRNNLGKWREKEREVLGKIGMDFVVGFEEFEEKLQLLDVGSCYNAFEEFEEFHTMALDLSPARPTVLKCDFLTVGVGVETTTTNGEVMQLEITSYHVVVFSLLLEYFPSAEQRLQCCEKAYKLLKPEGILVIITPDSKHTSANSQYFKSWRFVLAQLGFSRIKYEKLPHVHCMGFRKSPWKIIPQRWAKLHEKEQRFEGIFIPQDFNKVTENPEGARFTPEEIVEGFAALPSSFLYL